MKACAVCYFVAAFYCCFVQFHRFSAVSLRMMKKGSADGAGMTVKAFDDGENTIDKDCLQVRLAHMLVDDMIVTDENFSGWCQYDGQQY